MKILLVRPPLPSRTIGAAHASLCEPLELELLAGNLRDHDVSILDMRVDPTPLDDVLARLRPDLVGVTAGTVEVNTARAVLRRVRELLPAVTTVVGGGHATARPEDFAASFVSAVVLGDGVATLRELVEARERGGGLEAVAGLAVNRGGRQVLSPARLAAESLREFPSPDRTRTAGYRTHYFHAWVRPAMLLQASSGAAAPGTPGAPAPPRRVVQDVERVAAEVAERDEGVVFADDDALAEPERVACLCKLLSEAKVVRPIYLCARAQTVAENPELVEDLAGLGLEAVALAFQVRPDGQVPRVERRALDVLHRNGVVVSGELSVDLGSDVDDLRRLGELADRLGIDFPVFSTPTPYPGTALYDEWKGVLGTPDWELFDRVHAVLPTRLPLRKLYDELARLYDRAYGIASLPRLVRTVPWRQLPGLALQLNRFAGRIRRAHLDQEAGLHA